MTQGDDTGDVSCVEIGKQYLREKYQKKGNVFLTPVHRLDRPVSGVLCCARTDKCASRLTAQFRERQTIEKIYLAVIDGIPPTLNGVLQHYLLIDKTPTNKTKILPSAQKNSKLAELEYKILTTNERNQTLVKIKLLTGYKHQIRAQFSALGTPIIGDYKYATCDQNHAADFQLLDGHAIALHAFSLTFNHPTKREPMTITTTTVPEYFPIKI